MQIFFPRDLSLASLGGLILMYAVRCLEALEYRNVEAFIKCCQEQQNHRENFLNQKNQHGKALRRKPELERTDVP